MSDARSTRRTFLTGVAAMGLAGRTLLRSGDAAAAVHAAKKAAGSATDPTSTTSSGSLSPKAPCTSAPPATRGSSHVRGTQP